MFVPALTLTARQQPGARAKSACHASAFFFVDGERVADFAGVRTVGLQTVDRAAVDEEDERLALRRVEVIDAQGDRLADTHVRLGDAPHVRRARGQQQQRKRGEHFARVCTP